MTTRAPYIQIHRPNTPARTHYETWPAITAEMREQAPDICKGFGSMYQKLMGEGALSIREKELIAIGIGMAVRCKPCLFVHAERRRENALLGQYERLGLTPPIHARSGPNS